MATSNYFVDANDVAFDGLDNNSFWGLGGVVRVVQDGAGGTNGVFHYGSGTAVMPSESYNGANYWVDITFDADERAGELGPGHHLGRGADLAGEPAGRRHDHRDRRRRRPAQPTRSSAGPTPRASPSTPRPACCASSTAPNFEAPADAGANNVYDLTVSVSDGIAPAVTQAITVTVTDVTRTAPARTSSTIGDAPTTTETADPTDYELGMRFTANAAGTITELRYFRGAADASDTDTRVLNLWNAAGVRLGSGHRHLDRGRIGLAGRHPLGADRDPGRRDLRRVLRHHAELRHHRELLHHRPHRARRRADRRRRQRRLRQRHARRLPDRHLQLLELLGRRHLRPRHRQQQRAGHHLGRGAAPRRRTGSLAGTITATDANGNPLTYAIAGGADAALFTIDAQTGLLRFVSAPNYEAPADAGANNVYDLTVSVSDGIAPAVTQAITVTVTDRAENGTGSNVFGLTDAPTTTETTDPTDYELGMRFTANAAGTITELRYFRGAADANDTDTRVLNLWNAAGVLLGSVTVTSTAGESGWQVGTLSAPIAIQAGATYVVSYGTTQNYAVTANYFTTAHSGPDGVLTAGVASGVFADGTPGVFPTASYNASNYWVDVTFVPQQRAGHHLGRGTDLAGEPLDRRHDHRDRRQRQPAHLRDRRRGRRRALHHRRPDRPAALRQQPELRGPGRRGRQQRLRPDRQRQRRHRAGGDPGDHRRRHRPGRERHRLDRLRPDRRADDDRDDRPDRLRARHEVHGERRGHHHRAALLPRRGRRERHRHARPEPVERRRRPARIRHRHLDRG